MKRYWILAALFCALAWPCVAYAGTPLNVQLDPWVHGALITGVSWCLTQLFKKKVAPLMSGKWCPFISMGIGIAGAAATGFGSGQNIGQVLGGIVCGGSAMVAHDLGSSVASGLAAIGVRPKTGG